MSQVVKPVTLFGLSAQMKLVSFDCSMFMLTGTSTMFINSAGKRDRLGVLFPSDKLLVTNRPKAAAEGSGLRPLSYPRNGRGPLPKAAARAPLGFAAL